MLLYFEAPAVLGPANATYLAVIDSSKLSLVSSRNLGRPAFPNVRVFGFSANNKSVILGSAEEIYAGGTPKTRELRISELDARDLGVSRSGRVVQNPFDGYDYVIDATGTPWFSKEEFIPRSFYKYDPEERRVIEGIRVNNAFGLMFRNLFLRDGIMAFNSEADESGQVYIFDLQNEAPKRTVRMTGCGFKDAVISPDEAFAVAICEGISQREATFGSITKCEVDVFRVSTLQNLAAFPCSKGTVWHPIAVWHQMGHVRVATVDATGTLSLYNMSD